MPTTPKDLTNDAGWQQIEQLVEELHEASRTPMDASDFYQQLLRCSVTALAAEGGVVWMPNARGEFKPAYQINLQQCLETSDEAVALHPALLNQVSQSIEPKLYPPQAGTAEEIINSTNHALLVAGVSQNETSTSPTAVIQLFMRTGSSPQAERGWIDFLSTICEIASEFQTRHELRALRSEHDWHDQSLSLLRRIHRRGNLKQTAAEIANEGRRFVDCDRLSVVIRRGKKWNLLAASGVERIEGRADTTKKLQQFAEHVANWGEPLEYRDAIHDAQDLPEELSQLVEQYVDFAHARHLIAVPFSVVSEEADERTTQEKPSVVLIAEQFDFSNAGCSKDRTMELAMLCEPALRQSLWLDQFPLRTVLGIADSWANLTRRLGMTRLVFSTMLILAAFAALVWVPYDFEIEAAATLVPAVERDVFATASGTIREVRVEHGTEVQVGDVLALLEDPQLDLESERVQGEIATVRKRLEAIAVARTDREVREEVTDERLPLSAEAEQLQKRLESLNKQLGILRERRDALTLRSPIAGKVITLDVQNLLRIRPVQRGEVLFTIADASQGWELEAEIEQNQIGHVLEAQAENHPLPVRFRLDGDVDQVYDGRLESISETAVLAMDNLNSGLPAIRAKVSIDESEALPAARPGMNAQVRFYCGKRSLGYVWLHDAWEAIYGWLVF